MKALTNLTLCTTILALVVIVLGAYVRLSDAGLSCPDWPGCYGQLSVPSSETELAHAEAAFPSTPVETAKAWKEMTHRYLAGLLGLAIVAIAVLSYRLRTRHEVPPLLPGLMVVLVVFQALLGMWTVTMLLKPVIVTAHLLGGLATVSGLAWLLFRYWGLCHDWRPDPGSPPLRRWLVAGACLLVLQLVLGGWTSANYAALACADFPLCNGSVWPEMNVSEGFQLHRDLGRTTDGALISHLGLVAIQFVHRLGAVAALLTLAIAALIGIRQRRVIVRFAAVVVLVLLGLQVVLGAAVVLNARPLGFAVLHNANAALLLLAVLSLLFTSRYQPSTLVESPQHSSGT